MSLAEKLAQDYISAYKSGAQVRLAVLRLLKTAISNRLVELKQPGASLPDEEIAALIMKQAKQRKDSIEQYRAASRADLADREAQELAILEEYLPRQLTEQELEQAVAAAIAETDAQSMADMGKVMKAVMARHAGRVDGSLASAITRKKLSGGK